MSMTLNNNDDKANKILTPTNFISTPSYKQNLDFESIFKEPETYRIHELVNEIDSLDSTKKYHKQYMNFLEADQAASKLRELKLTLLMEKRSHIKSMQAQEIQEIEDAYQKELIKFNEYWNTKLNEFDHEAMQCEINSTKSTEETIQQYEQELNQMVPLRPKASTQHLTYKKMIDQLAKNDDFQEAHKVKVLCENLHKEEIEKARADKQNRIKSMILAFSQQKQKEFAVLKKKIEKARTELLKRRQQEAQNLSQKFLNLKKEKYLLHQLELSKFELAHRHFVPAPALSSQYRSKRDLSKSNGEDKMSNLLNSSNNSSEKKFLDRSFEEPNSALKRKSIASPRTKPLSPRTKPLSPRIKPLSPLNRSFGGTSTLNSSFGLNSNLLRPLAKTRKGYSGLGGGAVGILVHRNSCSASGSRPGESTPRSSKKELPKLTTKRAPSVQHRL